MLSPVRQLGPEESVSIVAAVDVDVHSKRGLTAMAEFHHDLYIVKLIRWMKRMKKTPETM